VDLMTVRHTVPPLDAENLDKAIEALRGRGMRVSAARRLVLEALFAAGEPISAERVAAGIEGRIPPSDLASVYRNLETLEHVGLVRHLHLGHGPGLYILSGAEEHEYLVCERCDALRAVTRDDMDQIRAAIHDRFGWTASFSHFPIVGLCPSCATDDPHHHHDQDHTHDHPH
jgi:Fur family ferric uptake transcriptional regulator